MEVCDEPRLSKEAEKTLAELPESLQRSVVRRLNQIAEDPKGVGYPLHHDLRGKRRIPANRHVVTWEMKMDGEEECAVILTIESKNGGNPRGETDPTDPLELLGDFVAWCRPPLDEDPEK